MILNIDKGLMYQLKQNDLLIEDYFIIKAISEGDYDLIDIWDNMFKDRHCVIIYNKLIANNFIKLDSSGQNDIFVLTEKSNHLLGI